MLWQCQALWTDIAPFGGEHTETSLHLSFICQEPAVSKSFPSLFHAIPTVCISSFALVEGASLSSFHTPPISRSHTTPSLSPFSATSQWWMHTPYVACMQNNAAGHLLACNSVCTIYYNLNTFSDCVCKITDEELDRCWYSDVTTDSANLRQF